MSQHEETNFYFMSMSEEQALRELMYLVNPERKPHTTIEKIKEFYAMGKLGYLVYRLRLNCIIGPRHPRLRYGAITRQQAARVTYKAR